MRGFGFGLIDGGFFPGCLQHNWEFATHRENEKSGTTTDAIRSTQRSDPLHHVPQRPYWNGAPERLRDAFRMTKQKSDRTFAAVCEVWSHQFGWELKLMIDGRGLQMSSVVRSAPEMLAISTRKRSGVTAVRPSWC